MKVGPPAAALRRDAFMKAGNRTGQVAPYPKGQRWCESRGRRKKKVFPQNAGPVSAGGKSHSG